MQARWAACLTLLLCRSLAAQQPLRVTLQEAEQRAVVNHPRIGSAGLNAQAAGAVVKQVRSAFQPQLTGNITSAGADRNTAIAAGTLQTSGLVSRAATGLGVSQLITDFGRTSKLAESARLRAEAQGQNVAATRAQVLLQVHQAYYTALAADAVLGVARERLEMLRLTLRQVRALAESSLKSTLDVSFAEVAVSESELLLYQAENTAKASRANLAAAMGDPDHTELSIVDLPLPDRLSGDVEAAVADAVRNRPDLAVLNLNQSAAERFAQAEKKLRYPALTAVAVVGTVPVHQTNFSDNYSAAGVNIALPILNGGLNSARRAEADLLAGPARKTYRVSPCKSGQPCAWRGSTPIPRGGGST